MGQANGVGPWLQARPVGGGRGGGNLGCRSAFLVGLGGGRNGQSLPEALGMVRRIDF